MHPQQRGDLLPHPLRWNNPVRKAMFQLELGPLKAGRQFFSDRLFNDARTGKPDEGARLRQDHISQIRVTGADSTCRRVCQYRDIKTAMIPKPLHRRACLGHLQKRKHTFLHPGAPAGGKDQKRELPPVSLLHRFRQLLSGRCPHAPHQKKFAEFCRDNRNPLNGSQSSLAGIRCLRADAVFFQFFLITGKMKQILRPYIRKHLLKAALIQYQTQPAAGSVMNRVLFPQFLIRKQCLPFF